MLDDGILTCWEKANVSRSSRSPSSPNARQPERQQRRCRRPARGALTHQCCRCSSEHGQRPTTMPLAPRRWPSRRESSELAKGVLTSKGRPPTHLGRTACQLTKCLCPDSCNWRRVRSGGQDRISRGRGRSPRPGRWVPRGPVRGDQPRQRQGLRGPASPRPGRRLSPASCSWSSRSDSGIAMPFWSSWCRVMLNAPAHRGGGRSPPPGVGPCRCRPG